jgi:hypothetical protein
VVDSVRDFISSVRPARIEHVFSNQRVLLVVFVLFSWFGYLTPAHAVVRDTPDSLILGAAPDSPYEVHVGVEVDQITFVNQKSENFGIVGTLRLEWDDDALSFGAEEFGRAYKIYDQPVFKKFLDDNSIFYPGFLIQNQQERRFSQKAIFIVFPNGHAIYLEKFSTVLQAPDFDFTQFPFDTQRFFVHVVSAHPTNFVKYVPLASFSQLGEKLGEEEWFFTDSWTEIAMDEGITGFPSSRFSFGFTARRHLDYYTVRIFIPLLVFVLVSWVTFFLEEYSRRIDIAGANLLIFVAFNFAISGDLPRLGYMTFLDFILVAMFIITGLIIVFNVGLRRLKITGREELARKMDQHALTWIYPGSYGTVILYAIYHFQYRSSL